MEHVKHSEHILLAAAYALVSVYYITTVSNPTFSQQLHGSVSSFMVLYSLAMSTTDATCTWVLLGLQWTLYSTLLDTPVNLPHWFIAYAAWHLVSKLLRATELRIFQLASELQRVVPAWEYQFLYCHTAAPRLGLTDAAARSDNEILGDFADMRCRGDTPYGLSSEDWALWYKTDHRSIFITRCQRRNMLGAGALATLTLYAWWWHGILSVLQGTSATIYIAIDLCMVASLFTESTTLQLLVYHTVFLSATGWLAVRPVVRP
jgi:hypothetical protein